MTTHLVSRLRTWLARRAEARMQRKRVRWTWKRRQPEDPIVTAVKRWRELPSMEKQRCL